MHEQHQWPGALLHQVDPARGRGDQPVCDCRGLLRHDSSWILDLPCAEIAPRSCGRRLGRGEACCGFGKANPGSAGLRPSGQGRSAPSPAAPDPLPEMGRTSSAGARPSLPPMEPEWDRVSETPCCT
ncbi:hypothetical protein GCM10010309_74880 [Streptomyces violaceochromogenes]|nr:hypothetical protein GCM10010309_74880 [Streptomyces violaceochromogenes]